MHDITLPMNIIKMKVGSFKSMILHLKSLVFSKQTSLLEAVMPKFSAGYCGDLLTNMSAHATMKISCLSTL